MNRMMKPLPLLGALIAAFISQSATAVPPPNPTASDAYNDTAGGTGALSSLVTPPGGSNNTAFGADALNSDTSGQWNTAFGSGALTSNATGDDNTAVGYSALIFATGDRNTAIGSASEDLLGSGADNVALGFGALEVSTTGSKNVALGSKALIDSSTGNSNIAIGYSAASTATTGSNNISIGDSAGSALTTGSNDIYIGNTGKPTESNTLRIGQGLTITSVNITGIWGNVISSGADVLIDASGHMGTVVSSKKYKKDIADMGDASSKLLTLRPVTFHYRSDDAQTRQYGLIAEEVAKVFPDLVARNEAGEVETVLYHELAPMLLNEVEKQAKEIASQSKEIASQSKEIAALQSAHDKDVADLRDLKQMFAAQNAALTKLQKEIDPQIRVAAR